MVLYAPCSPEEYEKNDNYSLSKFKIEHEFDSNSLDEKGKVVQDRLLIDSSTYSHSGGEEYYMISFANGHHYAVHYGGPQSEYRTIKEDLASGRLKEAQVIDLEGAVLLGKGYMDSSEVSENKLWQCFAIGKNRDKTVPDDLQSAKKLLCEYFDKIKKDEPVMHLVFDTASDKSKYFASPVILENPGSTIIASPQTYGFGEKVDFFMDINQK